MGKDFGLCGENWGKGKAAPGGGGECAIRQHVAVLVVGERGLNLRPRSEQEGI